MGKLLSTESTIKKIAREAGASLVGIASRSRLENAPPSADPRYKLPSAESAVCFAVKLSPDISRRFLAKKDWTGHCEERKGLVRTLYTIGDLLVNYLKGCGFEAVGVDINNTYRPETGTADITEMTEFLPDFAHRYAAVAAGLGRLGWSGNLLTPDNGAMVELGTVLTSACLVPDPLLDYSPCDHCKMCVAVCPVGMIGKNKTIDVTVAGLTETIAVKQPNTCCWIGCTGYHGLSHNGRWSNWSPYRLCHPIPTTKQELDALNISLQKADPQMQMGNNSFTDYRRAMFDPQWFTNTVCGNCRLVCWHDRHDREYNTSLVHKSGLAVLQLDGQHSATHGDIIEMDTPYLVKVALSKSEHALLGDFYYRPGTARAPIDDAVLTYITESTIENGKS
jgi:ferredoxin